MRRIPFETKLWCWEATWTGVDPIRFAVLYAVLLAAVLLAAAGCELRTPTQIFLHADADILTREGAAFLRATVTSQEGDVRLRHEFPMRGEDAHAWPIDLSILPLNGDPSRSVTVQIEALDPSLRTFNERSGRYSFLEDELFETTIFLQDACIGVMCADGRTCDGGRCVPIDSIPDGPENADLQAGVCRRSVCWEHPRPAGNSATGVCAYADDGGAIAIAGTVAWLDETGWTPEEVWADDFVVEVECWGRERAVAMSRERVAVRDERGWDDLAVPANPWLESLWASSPNDIWVVGREGTVLRSRNGTWSVPPGLGVLDTDLDYVFGNEREVWIAGPDVLLRYPLTGGEPQDVENLPPIDNGASRPRRVYLEWGEQRALIHGRDLFVHDGRRWQEAYQGMQDYTFRSLVATESRLYAGGPRGRLEWLDADSDWSAWVEGPGFRGAEVEGMALGGSSLFAVGDNAMIGVLRQGRWTNRGVVLSSDDLSAVGRNRDEVLAVGTGGLILQRERPGIWRRRVLLEEDGAAQHDLAGVAFDGESWWVAGAQNTVFRSVDGVHWVADAPANGGDWNAICAREGQVLLVGDGGEITLRSSGDWTAQRFSETVDLFACGASDTWLVGDGDGTIYRVEDGLVTLSQRYVGEVTQITRGDSFVAIVAGGVMYRVRADGTCDEPCDDATAPRELREVLLEGDQPRWWRTRLGVESHDGGTRHRGFVSAMVDDGEGVIAVGARAAIISASP